MEEGLLVQANAKNLPIADNSIDMIFTDPPYPKEYLPCYQWLVSEAARILKPGGFVFAMAGQYWLDQIYTMFWLEKQLSYFWCYTLYGAGDAPKIWPRNTVANSKSLLAYYKVPAPKGPRLGNVLSQYVGRKDKRFHHWGQCVDTARYYIDCFSWPGDLICDPFIGGGTTAVACELLGRRWIGCDVDRSALLTSKQRLADKETGAVRNLPLFSRLPECADIGTCDAGDEAA